ncbi:MAG: hypothetical protein L3J82_02420 [Planctomycetes bacterium]|nr:hypothetical protein [Planctomycetota bacterium]
MEDLYRKGGTGYGDFKKRLFGYFMDTFGEAREKHEELSANKDYVEDVLSKGAAKARSIAGELMDNVRKVTGLR